MQYLQIDGDSVSCATYGCMSEAGGGQVVTQVSRCVAAGECSRPIPRILDQGRGGIDGRRRGEAKRGRWVVGGPQRGGALVLAPPHGQSPSPGFYLHANTASEPLSSRQATPALCSSLLW